MNETGSVEHISAEAVPPAVTRCTHFVRFTSLSDQRFQNAVQAFGHPDFLHRHWDQRARREIADGDLIVFAKGDADQPVVPFNGSDEVYA